MKKKAMLIAEKPSLMKDIQRAYNTCKGELDYDIDFYTQYGHLVELLDPVEIDSVYKSWDISLLPIDPAKEGGWQYKVKKSATDAYTKIKSAVKSGAYDVVIHAGDPDQEGELLVNLVLNKIGNKLPVLRLWSNDTTQTGLCKALHELKSDSEPMYRRFYEAALTRQHADYLFGMNGSRAIADRIKTDGTNKIAVGRVMTCVQTMIVDREDEIKNFVPQTSYGVSLLHTNGLLTHLCDKTEDTDDAGIILYKDKQKAIDVISMLSDISTVKEIETKRKKTQPPKLFKLATAQIEAARMGYSAQETLDIIQRLYETHHYVSYPRTDCEVLSSNENFRGIISSAAVVDKQMKNGAEYALAHLSAVINNKRYVDDTELSKHGHSALVPTTLTPDMSALNDDEKLIYTMIAKRFLCAFQPPLVQEKTTVFVQNENYLFRGAGKRTIDKGFTEFIGADVIDAQLPELHKEERLTVSGREVLEKTTSCPKRFTEGSIIAAMENPGKYLVDTTIKKNVDNLVIGTSATRGEILKKLVADKYIAVKKTNGAGVLYPTEFGTFMIHTIKGVSLTRVDTTGQWEEVLTAVRNGQMSIEDATKYVYEQLDVFLSDIKGVNRVFFGDEKKRTGAFMTCPGCGKDIIAGPKNYFCSGYKDGCKYSLMKNFCGAVFSTDDAQQLFEGKTIKKKLKKKTGNDTWTQALRFNGNEGKLEFVKEKR